MSMSITSMSGPVGMLLKRTSLPSQPQVGKIAVAIAAPLDLRN